ncbi:hypothetical protein ACLOJK_004370 [Asimina triloba]
MSFLVSNLPADSGATIFQHPSSGDKISLLATRSGLLCRVDRGCHIHLPHRRCLCLNFLMSLVFLVSNLPADNEIKSPLLMQAPCWRDRSCCLREMATQLGKIYEIGSSGISSLKGHSKRRNKCLNDFISLYGTMPLVATHVKAVNANHEWFW